MALGTIWQFKTANFTVIMDYDYETDFDHSWADEETLEKLESGEWVSYQFRARVLDSDGNEIGADYLGDSIHSDPEDFRDHIGLAEKSRRDGCNYGSYFMDMVSRAIEEARATYAKPRARLREIAA
jgi:hypothetical protein